MKEKVTQISPQYPKGSEPNYIEPLKYSDYRFALGKQGSNPLVAICMNPSAAMATSSDRTINRIIKIGSKLGKDGWIVFNTYPERATDAGNISNYDKQISDQNIETIRKYLLENHISEVWGAWGDDKNLLPLSLGKKQLLSMLNGIGVKVFYFGTLTKAHNPRHPLQRYEKWSFTSADKHYL